MSNTDTLVNNSSNEFSDPLSPCKIFLAADSETHYVTVEELLTPTYTGWTNFQQRVHCSPSAVMHAPFHASVLRPASQVGPVHEAAGMGEVS